MANRAIFHEMRKNIHLTDLQRSIIIGTVLGDGSLIETFSKKNLRLQIDHCEAQKEYVFWKYDALKTLILTPPTYQRKNKSWRFRTISHPELTEIGQLFYQKRRKIIPRNLEKILMPIGLAIWFMDDGARYQDRDTLILNTQCFSHAEVQRLKRYFMRILKSKEIDITLHYDKSGWRLHIKRESAQQFRKIVEPYMLSSLMYKIGEPRRDYTSAPVKMTG